MVTQNMFDAPDTNEILSAPFTTVVSEFISIAGRNILEILDRVIKEGTLVGETPPR